MSKVTHKKTGNKAARRAAFVKQVAHKQKSKAPAGKPA